MRLLSKNEVARQKTLERKTEIDEGAKIARRIDTMRETAAKEEAALTKFREEASKTTKEAISVLVDKKTVLENEIGALEIRRVELQKPLDAEWAEVAKEKKAIGRVGDELQAVRLNLNQREDKISLHEREISVEKERIRDEKARTRTVLREAEETLDKAKESKVAADMRVAEADVYVEERQKTILSREAELLAREKNLDLKESSLKNKEKELLEYERFINDKYETLQRTIKRLKK